MKHLDSLEFEIKFQIREVIEAQGLMATDDPRVARLFRSLAAIQELKQTTYQPRYQRLARAGR